MEFRYGVNVLEDDDVVSLANHFRLFISGCDLAKHAIRRRPEKRHGSRYKDIVSKCQRHASDVKMKFQSVKGMVPISGRYSRGVIIES